MPYRGPSDEELISRVNARLGLANRAPDDPLAGPIRMKGPSELPGYTQETPGQESARLTNEYNRAGSNDRSLYGEVSDVVAAPLRGVYDSAMTLGSIPIDAAATAMGYGRPVTNQIVQGQRLAQEGGEGWGDSLIRNVVSSVVTNTTAAIGGTVASGGNPGVGVAAVIGVNALPVAAQQYQIGLEEGLTEVQSGVRAASYGAVAGSVSAILEKILPGMTAATTARFAKGLADDVAMPLARSIFGRMSRTANSEGVEEAVQNVANQFIDAATTQITGNSNLEKPYASIQERLMDVAQAYGMGAAAGGLVQGGLELTNTRRAIQEIGQQSVQQQPQAPVAPVAPTPMQPEMPVAPVAPEIAPVAPAQQQPIPADSGTIQPGPIESATPNVAGVEEQPAKVAGLPLRDFLDAITPEQKQAIATLDVPSRGAFAQILGVEPSQLPPIVMSKKKRRAAASYLARRDTEKAADSGIAPPAAARSLDQQPSTENAMARPGPLSEVLPTGAETPATAFIPTPQRNFTGPDSAKTTTLREIGAAINEFAESLSGVKTPVSEGVRQPKRGVLFGFQNWKTGTVRLANRQDVLTLSHEMAHVVDTTTDVFKSAPSAAEAEMTAIGTSPGYTPAQYPIEGRAEFIRAYIQEGPQFAQQMAPEMFKHFTERMKASHGKAFRALDKAGELYRTFNPGMNAQQRLRSQMVRRDDVGETLSRTASGLTGLGNKTAGNFWDIAEVGRRMASNFTSYKKLVTGKTEQIPSDKRPDRMLDYLHGLAATRGKEMILDGMIDAGGNRVGKGLKQVLEPLGGVPENVADFESYLAARRTLAIGDGQELAKFNAEMIQLFGDDWKMVMPRSGPISIAEARAIVGQLEAKNPKLQDVADDYYEFWKGVLKYMGEMSPTLQVAAERILLRDPGSYTPFMRQIESNGKASPVASAQSGQVGRRLKGSNRAIIDPLTQAVQVVEARLATAHQRKLLETIVALADSKNAYSWGMAQFIEKLNPGETPDGHSFEVVNAQGKKDTYQINDPGVMLMLSALDPVSLSSIPVFGKALDVTFGKPSALLKTFATGINPRFALVTQPLFNVWELMAKGAAFTDRYDSKGASNALTGAIRRAQNHGQLIGDWLRFWLARTIQQTGRAMGAKIDGDTYGSVPFLGQAFKYLDRAKQEGVEFSQSIRNDDSAAFDVSREAAGLQNSAVFRNPVKIVQEDGASGLLRWMFSSIPGWVGDTLNASEYAAKAAVLKSFLEGQGLTLNSNLTMRQKVDAARATKESFGNYARRGATSRYLEKLSPYLTAPQVHGRSLLEAIKEDPANVMQVGMYLLIGSFLLTLKNLQDDEYREADPAQKARYVHLGNSSEGWSLLPAYSDFMTVFHGAGVILAHLYDGSDAGSQAVETTKSLASQFFPTPNPVLPSEAISQFTGQDLRTGRDIVPNYKDRREGDAQATVVSQRPAREQYTDKTSRIAVAAGYVTGISPIRIEHALDSLTARFVTDLEKVGRGMKTPQSIVLPRTREPGLLSAKDQATTDLYAEIQKANERKNDPNQKESPLHREQRLMLESADSARDAYTALMRREKDQEKVNEYSRLQRSLSRTAVTMYRAGEYSHSPFRVAKRVAEVESARLDQDDAEVAKLVYNGIDGLMRARPMKAGQGKTMAETVAAWEEDRAEAQALRDALAIPKTDLIKLAQEHMRNTKVPAGLMMNRMAKLNAALK